MKKQSVFVAHFSPTGSTAKIATHLGKALSHQIIELDLSKQILEKYTIDKGSLIVVAVPVYRGRVPAKAIQAIRQIPGNGIACVSIVVYGNRAFDDALLELNDTLAEQKFKVIASGGFIAQHSLAPEIATGRPDAKDFTILNQFADDILKIIAQPSLPDTPKVPGKRPYVNLPSPQVVPVVNDNCNECGKCVKDCPVAAISIDDYNHTDPEKCILCMRCVQNCTSHARALPLAYREKVSANLQQYKARHEPNVYISTKAPHK